MTNNPIPTVKIVNPDDYTVINESDYDPAIHTLYVEPGEPVQEEVKAIEEDIDPGPVITHEIAVNGVWAVSRDGEVIRRGRGKRSLGNYIKSL